MSRSAEQTEKAGKFIRLKSQPIFSVASQTEWRDFPTGMSSFSKYPWFANIDKYNNNNNNNKLYFHDRTSTYSVAKAILRVKITS